MQCEKPLVKVKADSELESLMHALSTRRAVEDSERKILHRSGVSKLKNFFPRGKFIVYRSRVAYLFIARF
jgi:hypothetical protein